MNERNEVVVKAQMKASILFKNVNEGIKYFDRRRNQNKKRAFILKMASLFSTALITFLLGVKSINNNILSDITLLLAAGVTVFNGIDAFYNHRDLWEKDVKTLSSLRDLKRNLEYYITGEPESELSLEVLNDFQKKLQSILSADINIWTGVRDEIKIVENDEKN